MARPQPAPSITDGINGSRTEILAPPAEVVENRRPADVQMLPAAPESGAALQFPRFPTTVEPQVVGKSELIADGPALAARNRAEAAIAATTVGPASSIADRPLVASAVAGAAEDDEDGANMEMAGVWGMIGSIALGAAMWSYRRRQTRPTAPARTMASTSSRIRDEIADRRIDEPTVATVRQPVAAAAPVRRPMSVASSTRDVEQALRTAARSTARTSHAMNSVSMSSATEDMESETIPMSTTAASRTGRAKQTMGGMTSRTTLDALATNELPIDMEPLGFDGPIEVYGRPRTAHRHRIDTPHAAMVSRPHFTGMPVESTMTSGAAMSSKAATPTMMPSMMMDDAANMPTPMMSNAAVAAAMSGMGAQGAVAMAPTAGSAQVPPGHRVDIAHGEGGASSGGIPSRPHIAERKADVLERVLTSVQDGPRGVGAPHIASVLAGSDTVLAEGAAQK